MINLQSILSFSASGLMLLTALTAAGRSAFSRQKAFFVFSAAVISSALLFQAMTIVSSAPAQALVQMQFLLSLTVFLPAACLPFFFFFARDCSREEFTRRLPGIITLVILLGIAAILLPVQLVVREVSFTESGEFWGVVFSGYGKGLGIFLILANVFYLYSMENTYRSSTVAGKVTLKYPVLGVFAASMINFIVTGRVLALSAIDRNYMALEACGLIILSISLLYADIRYPLFEIRTAARQETPSVITVIVSGLYILAIALISYISAAAGLPYDRFGIYVLVVFIAFLLLAIAISGKSRRRLRRFLNENFNVERYNYRKEWRHYANLMVSSSSIDDFISNTISSLCETVMVKKGLIWVDVGNGKYATYGLSGDDWSEGGTARILEFHSREPIVTFKRKRRDKKRIVETRNVSPAPGGEYAWVEAVAYLCHGEECRGFIALGGKDMETEYTDEDRNFLSSVADQAMLTLENLLMEERFLESSQMESFNRFASFVIHDLKNTVGMLSLTVENARDNMDDKEFQRDAIVTIKRSVEKMRSLIDSLNAHKSPSSITRVRADVTSLVEKKVRSFLPTAESKGIVLETQIESNLEAAVDPSAIERILENLVTNAVEATPEKGRILVSAGSLEGARIVIEVSDTGSGFDPVYLDDHLFKPFRTTKKNGLGIGLVLCKTLAEAHGGTVTAANGAGKGAIVSVIIPSENG